MNLNPSDLEMMTNLRIPSELLERAGIVRVTDREAREEYGIRGGGDMTGVAYPYFDPESMANSRRRHYVRIRRDHPEVEEGKEKKKYVAPYGDRKHFYFPPTPELFADITVPIVLVEAEKSVLALSAWAERVGRKILPLGLGGCFGWIGKVGIKETAAGERVPEHGTIPDLGICRDGRKTYVLLDSNVSTNPKVQQARSQLVGQLRKQQADVSILDLPDEEGVNGPDDFLAKCGDEAMGRILDGVQTRGAILSELKRFIRRYVTLTDAQATVCACWTLHTYMFGKYRGSTGYLHISSPTPECGKSRLLEVLELFVHKPCTVGGSTAAAFIRTIDQERPTILFDEADVNLADKETGMMLNGILNNGWRPNRPYLKCVGENQHVKKFRVYGPKAIAGIGFLSATVASRSFPIKLQRQSKNEQAAKFFVQVVQSESESLREKMEKLAEERVSSWVANLQPEVPAGLTDRREEVSWPLLAIAEDAGGQWPSMLRGALAAIFAVKKNDRMPHKLQLLLDIRAVFDEQKEEKLSTADLLTRLCEIETSPWAEFKAGKPLSPTVLADLLRGFEIEPSQIWLTSGKTRGYRRDDFVGAWDRYLRSDREPLPPLPPFTPSETVGTVGASIHAASSDFFTTVGKEILPGQKSEFSPALTRGLPYLPSEKGGEGVEGGNGDHPRLVLPCPVHGNHTDWWLKILPDGGEMACAKCDPNPGEQERNG